MDMILAERAARYPLSEITAAGAIGASAYLDPLDDDHPDDEVVLTTRRAICRVALVATEAAGRFERESVPHDPMSWMLSPRTLFAGASAVDACLDRDACLRGILIHGLSLGLDADPSAIDALAEDEGGEESADPAVGIDAERLWPDVPPTARPARDGLRLFTATIVSRDGPGTVHAFHASLAMEAADVAGRLHRRMGAASAGARIVEGFDPTEPLVAALVSDAISDTLSLIAGDPTSPIATGLDLNVEQRFLG